MCMDCESGREVPVVTDYQEAVDRVRQGSAMLTSHFGTTDWARHIDLDRLDIQSGGDCVGAQLVMDDWFSFRELFPGQTYSDLVRKGFDSPGVNREELDFLNQAWREEIISLTTAVPATD